MQRKGRAHRRRSGFTLIELLLVIGIIALLAAFVVPQFMGTERRAKVELTKGMIGSNGQLATVLDIYRAHMGKYPEELKELYEKPDDEEEAAKWEGPYIKDVSSLKDAWQRDLQYKCPGEVNEDSYDLWSMGEDGDDGTDDDIRNWTAD